MICAWPPCGREFTPREKKHIYCHMNCRQAAYVRRRYENDPEFRERVKARQREDYVTMPLERRAPRDLGKRRWKALQRKSLRAAGPERPKEG